MNIRKPRKILLIQTAFLGDLVLTLPLLEAMRERWPEAQITALVEAAAAGLLEGHPAVDNLATIDKRTGRSKQTRMLSLIRTIRDLHCDLALIPHRSFRSALIARLAGIRERVGFTESAGAFLLTERVGRLPGAYEGARNLSLLQPLGGSDTSPIPRLAESAPAAERVTGWLESKGLHQQDFVAFAPGSIWYTKRWPMESWIGLSRELTGTGENVVLVGGAGDHDLAREIQRAADGEPFNAAGSFSILESAELLRRAKLLISGDSAPVHLAVAVGSPVLAIFGPTVPEFGFAPPRSWDRVIGLDLSCRPCAIHGGDSCPLEHHRCMRELTPEAVAAAAGKMLQGTVNDRGERKAP